MLRVALLAVVFCGCIQDPTASDDPEVDARRGDAAPADVGAIDAGVVDAEVVDAARPEDAVVIPDQAFPDAQPVDMGPPPPPPPACDQPEPAACEAAGCQWTAGAGCVNPTCRFLDDVACDRSPWCVLAQGECRPPSSAVCATLPGTDCRRFDGCVWNGEACLALADAPCEALTAYFCELSPMCRPVFAEECLMEKQQEPDEPPPEPEAQPEPQPEPEPNRCDRTDDCRAGEWCTPDRICVSCEVPARCEDAP